MDRSAADFDYYWERRNDVVVRALTNRLYQQERQRIMEGREASVKVLSIIAGSAAFIKISDASMLPWIGITVVAASTCSLIFGFGAKARDAAKRATEWAMLDRDINQVGPSNFTPEQVNSWAARCNEIEAGEPAPNVALLQRCYERACEATRAEPTKIGGWWTRHRPIFVIP